MCFRLEKGDSVSIQFTSCYLPTLLIFKKSVKESDDNESDEESDSSSSDILVHHQNPNDPDTQPQMSSSTSSSLIHREEIKMTLDEELISNELVHRQQHQQLEQGEEDNLSKADQRVSQHFKNRVEEIQKMSLSDKLNTTEV